VKGIPNVSIREVKRRLAAGEPLHLIDVLTRDHYRKGHIPGSRSACVFEVTFLEQVAEIGLDRSSPIVVYGSSRRSRDASVAAEKLGEAGYRNVAAMRGGLAAWASAGFPVEGNGVADALEPEAEFLPADGVYPIDTVRSRVEWSGRNANTRHHGTVGIAAGEIRVRRGAITGRIEIDMTVIRNLNLEGDPLQPVLVSHLQSDDFFLVSRFPRAVLTIEEAVPVKPAGAGSAGLKVKGTLKLRGIGGGVRFPAIAGLTPEGGIQAQAHFDIDRTRWKVIYGSARFFERLGMHLVFDEISFEVRILTGPGRTR